VSNWLAHAKLQSNYHQHINSHIYSTGPMTFLTPTNSVEAQRTEG